MTVKRETSEKRERMIGECHICSSSGLWSTTHMHGSLRLLTGQQGRKDNKKMKEGGSRFKCKRR